MEERMASDLSIPITLGELLHVFLSPLLEALEREGHDWAPLGRRVLTAYLDGRDIWVEKAYGPEAMRSVHVCTYNTADTLIAWAKEVEKEMEDFDQWRKEMGGQ